MGRFSFLLPMISGVALWLSFPGPAWFWLAWVALTPFLWFCLEVPRWRGALGGHFLMAGLYFGGTLYWIPEVLIHYGRLDRFSAYGCDLLLVAALSVLLLPFTLLFRSAGRRSPAWALLGAPGFWLATEWMRNYFPAHGFPWASLGYSQAPYPVLIQVVDLGSVYLLSYLLVGVNAALVAWWKYGRRRAAAAALAAFLLANGYGVYRLYFWTPPGEGPPVSLAVVQGNIALAEAPDYYRQQYFVELPRLYRAAVRDGARLVIFPEAQNPYVFPDDRLFAEFWSLRVRQSGGELLFNGTALDPSDRARYFNSVHLLNRSGEAVYRYDKVHLVPFGEYLPWRRWLGFARPLVAEVSNFTPGRSFPVGEVAGTPFATLVCYEGIFPELSRAFVRRGAALLFNLSNDSWFGDTAAPAQHLEMGRFRAIETRKPFVRAANSGYSAVISPQGEVLQRTRLFEQTVLRAEVRGNSWVPLAVRVGDWPAIALIIGSLVLWMAALLRPAAKTKRSVKA